MRGIGKIYTDADSIRSRLAKLHARDYVDADYYAKAMPKLLAFLRLTETALANERDVDESGS